MVPLGGVFHLIDRTTRQARRSIDPGGAAYDPQLSPDGTTIAFVRDGDLWIVDAPAARRASSPSTPRASSTASPSSPRRRSSAARRGYWWSPDSTRSRSSAPTRATSTRSTSPTRATPSEPPVPFKYPRAGTAERDRRSRHRRRPPAATPRWLTWDLAKYPYLAASTWPKRGPLAALVLDRDQTDARAARVRSGDRRVARRSCTEHDDAWINVDVGAPRWLDDGSGFLWMTEAHGRVDARAARARRRARPRADHARARPAPPRRRRRAAARSSRRRRDPTRQDVWRVPLDGGAPMRLTDGDGVAERAASKHGVVVVETALAGGRPHASSRSPTAARTSCRASPSGRRSCRRPCSRPSSSAAARTTSRSRGRARSIRTRRYPVLLKVYGGPHAQSRRRRARRLRDGPVVRRRRLHRRAQRQPRHAEPRPRVGARDPART